MFDETPEEIRRPNRGSWSEECYDLLSEEGFKAAQKEGFFTGTDDLIWNTFCVRCKHRIYRIAKGCLIFKGYDSNNSAVFKSFSFEPIDENTTNDESK